ncbi:hypothetical protein BN59_01007 [Legionella massiliensis]|uniref:Glycosyltransferase RgtA/B/C/D-like domain-containing protein n=1 Tax=Legionella massiliensis TaxID=1034943 RepID=A0A078KUQ3_9GAMM|nr:hypothetical protein [Legionella massiliensis]CDZ76732.1 hypothetical protein BN59_01007 [Legionella massiliensis]CEE12470.1 hypothetical protein BN1094_01007 [Legionella massiliensis]
MAFLSNPSHKISNKSYFWSLGILCLAYLIFEGFFVFYAALSMDDFWLSYHNYQYKSALPYRDFPPYKTVLGYYLFLIPLSLFHGVLKPLIYTKLWVAILNALCMGGLGIWLRKFFDSLAILYALLLVAVLELFLFYSVDIRVDIITYWTCLIAVLFVFEEKYAFAGLTIGLSFLVCQKAVWYIIAINCGLVCHWMVDARHWKMVKDIFIFNLSALIILCSYILFWTYFSSFQTVLNSIFYEAYIVSSDNWFVDHKYYNYWRFSFIVNNNPGFLLWPIAYLGLFVFPIKKRAFITSYATVIAIFILLCKQPFSYYLLAGLPMYLIVYSAFFSAVLKGDRLSKNNKKLIVIFSVLYILFLLFLFFKLSMQSSYLIAVFIPISLIVLCSVDVVENWQAIFNNLIFSSFLMIGIIFPLFIVATLLPSMDGRYQRSMVYLVQDLLATGGTYIAGVPLLHDIKQPVPGLEHIVGSSASYLEHPTKELATLMQLKSLYFSPDTMPEIIESIKKAPIKLYVDNNRFHLLPQQIHDYLATQYQHFWGSIFLYAPLVKAGEQSLDLKFAGDYQVEAEKGAEIDIDHQRVTAGSIISLKQQSHVSKANSDFRLRLIPPSLKQPLEPQFKDNAWQKVLSWN